MVARCLGNYTRFVHRLGSPRPPAELASFAKAARLDALARAGLPVPEGWVLLPRAKDDGPDAESLSAAWPTAARGPFVARMCLRDEDGATASAAGMGRSLGGLEGLDAVVAALEELRRHAEELGGLRWALLVQRQIAAKQLAVCLHSKHCPHYIEIHPDPGVAALDDGRSPDYRGPIHAWPDESAAELTQLLAEVSERADFPRGLDAELVNDAQGWWVVQLRPLVRPLFEDWPLFVSLLEEEDRPALNGAWVADFEHNPAPLSFAHRWLLAQLRAARSGAAGEPRDFNGWLYLRTPLRELSPAPAEGRLDDARDSLARLLDTWLPELRGAVEHYQVRLEADPPLRAALDEALALFMTMADRYQRDLMPARRLARELSGTETAGALAQPATLVDKAAHLHVLPIEWDLASESLADRDELQAPANEGPPLELGAMQAHEIASLLGELDDHFFAWGLRPLRSFYLHCARRLKIDARLAFELRGHELLELSDHVARAPEWLELARARLLLRARESQLEAPARIVDGCPYPDAGQRGSAAGSALRGVGIGEPCTGALTHRASLSELIDRPPEHTEVVALPALTAPAAWVLHRMGIARVCTAHGGAASHGSLMARELGLSAIIGARGIAQLDEGTRVLLDTRRGFVRPAVD